MEKKLLWELFLDTGEPLCWLLARRAGKPRPAPPAGGKDGTPPVPR